MVVSSGSSSSIYSHQDYCEMIKMARANTACIWYKESTLGASWFGQSGAGLVMPAGNASRWAVLVLIVDFFWKPNIMLLIQGVLLCSQPDLPS